MNVHKRASRFWAFFLAVVMTVTMLPSNALVPVFAQEAETPVIAPDDVNGDAEISEETVDVADDNSGNVDEEGNADTEIAPEAAGEDAARAGEVSVIALGDVSDNSVDVVSRTDSKRFYGGWYKENDECIYANPRPWGEYTASVNAVEDIFSSYYSNSMNSCWPHYNYSWYEVAADGKETLIVDADGEPKSEDESLHVPVNNLTQEKKYHCVISLVGIKYVVKDADGNYDYKKVNEVGMSSANQDILRTKYNNKTTVDYYCTVGYSGPTKDTIQKYVSVSSNLKNITLSVNEPGEVFENTDFFNEGELTVSANIENTYEDVESNLSYHSTLVPHFTDGTTGEAITEDAKKPNDEYRWPYPTTSRRNIAPYVEVAENDVRWVDSYDWTMDIYYGGIQVGSSVKKTVTMQAKPVGDIKIGLDDKRPLNDSDYVHDVSGNSTGVLKKDIRKGETKTFYADVDLRAGWSEFAGDIKYQWQQSKDEGTWSDISGQTAASMQLKITDLSLRYRCKVSVKDSARKGYLPYEGYSPVFRFKNSFDNGYKVLDRAPRNQSVGCGEEVKFFIDDTVDSGYQLSYQWQRRSLDASGEFKEDKEDETGFAWEAIPGQTGKTYSITPSKPSDFESVNTWIRVAVTVTPSSGTGPEVHYTSFFYQEDAGYRWGMVPENDPAMDRLSRVEIKNGDPAELEVQTTVKNGYTLEKNWYKVKAKAEVKEDDDDGKVFVDPTFIPPTDGEYLGEMRELYDEKGEKRSYNVYVEKTPLAATNNGTKLTVSGANVSGDYVCRVKYYLTSDAANKEKYDYHDYIFQVSYITDTELFAYAKNDEVEKVVGESATLHVFATNIDATKYPITYQWEKLNNETKKYDILNNNTASYTIPSVTKADFTDYKVTVKDGVNTKVLRIKLKEGTGEVISHTMPTTVIEKKAGETAELKVNAVLPTGASNVVYTWAQEQVNQDVDSEDYGNKYWRELPEIITNTHSVIVDANREDKEDRYQCKVTYVYGDELKAEDIYIFRVKTPGDITVENLSPIAQTKELGEDVTFSLRVITNKEGITNDSISYQWYKWNKDGKVDDAFNEEGYRPCDTKMEGQTTSSLTLSGLKKEDLGRYYCAIKVGNTYKTMLFRVQAKCAVSLDKKANKGTVKVSYGDTVTLAPVLNNTDGHKLAYQWYYEETKIPGATGSTYVIENVDKKDVTSYYCEITCEDHESVITYNVTLVLRNTSEESGITIKPAKGFEQVVKAVLGKTNVEFKIEAKSLKNLELKYQWGFSATYEAIYDEDNKIIGYRPGEQEAIDGATGDSYVLPLVTKEKLGAYSCLVTDTEGNRASYTFIVEQTKNLELTDAGEIIGYKTKLGGNITLDVKATIDPTYSVVYQWYKFDEELNEYEKLENETASTLKRTKVTLDDLGLYQCGVRSSNAEEDVTEARITYRVYIPSGLVVEPGPYLLTADSKGAVNMYVKARADSGEKIKYSWYRFVEDEKGEYIEAESSVGYRKLGADEADEYKGFTKYDKKALSSKSSYKINKLVEADYGIYYCEVSTNYGETPKILSFELKPTYIITRAKRFALENRTVNLTAKIVNPASDLKYTYKWLHNPSKSTNWKDVNCNTAVYKAKMPKTGVLNNLAYETFGYRCEIDVYKGTDKLEDRTQTLDTSVNVLHNINFETKKLPETNHPSERYSVKGYKATGAVSMTITFNTKTDVFSGLHEEATAKGGVAKGLLIIDKYGNEYTLEELCDPLVKSTGSYTGTDTDNHKVLKLGSKRSITVKGDWAIFVYENNDYDSYGYKVDKITKKLKPPVKGKKVTVSNIKYKVTKTTNSTKTSGEVAAVGVKSKSLKKATVKPTIKINGYTFKVTAVNKNTFKNCKKVTTITIGKNVKTIGANTFRNTKALKKITIKGTAIKTVKKKAFAKTSKKLVIKVPAKKKVAYKKLFKKAGFKGTVK